MEFDYNVNLVFDGHFYGKKNSKMVAKWPENFITYFYDWPLRIKTAEDMLHTSTTMTDRGSSTFVLWPGFQWTINVMEFDYIVI